MKNLIEQLMKEYDLELGDKFKILSSKFKGEYYFRLSEIGNTIELVRSTNYNGYEIASFDVLGRLISGVNISKIGNKGIIEKDRLYYYLNSEGVKAGSVADSDFPAISVYGRAFYTEEECLEYKKFLDVLSKYRTKFKYGELNKYLALRYKTDVTVNNTYEYLGGLIYLTDPNNFIEEVGEDAIKKYMFDVE